ncbi:MAG: hypothetical protein J2P53_05500, partial [Bradyrhizobiaceae bacterium]|nr:hypothetical protein [Bradyrhizobiaceae bacterium]
SRQEAGSAPGGAVFIEENNRKSGAAAFPTARSGTLAQAEVSLCPSYTSIYTSDLYFGRPCLGIESHGIGSRSRISQELSST